jgi:hypothetical protein
MPRPRLAARAATLAALLLLPASAQAQGLRGKISSLFIFGGGDEPLFLAGSADPSNPASIQAHGRHFVPASAAENAAVIDFVTDAIGANIANLPIGSTSGSTTFRFAGGVPVKTSTSAGPVFAERAQTLGRGRVLAGVNRSGLSFKSLRGVDLENLQLVFTHENVDFPGCDAQFGDRCSKMGVPSLENDVIDVRLALDIDVRATAFYATYGVTDRIDLSAVVPIVQTSVRGSSDAQIVPFGGPTAAHFFSGTPSSPGLEATRATDGSSTGVGDVAVRVKAGLRQTDRTGVALLADARFPTGSTDDLLGSGSFAARGIAIVSSRFGDVSPHLNVGYLYRAGRGTNDAVLGTLGFDQLLAEHVTMAADLISELQVGRSALVLPKPVTYDAPFRRTVQPTAIPDMRDDIVSGSFGGKFTFAGSATLIVNALFPLNRGGLRPGVAYTAGLEYAF